MSSKNSYAEEITLDLACRENAVIVKAKQFDNIVRTLDVTLYDSRDGRYWYETEATAEIRVQRPDGVLVTAECIKMHLDGITHYGVYLTDEMLAAAGRARADIRVMKETETISAGFIIEVFPTARGSKPAGYVSDTVNIKKLTTDKYAEIPHSTNTLYIVTEQNGAVCQYLGDTEIDTEISGSDLNALKENFVTNIILKKDIITVTGTGTYVNTKYEFPAENGVEYTLRIEKVTGGTDTPTAFIRTLDENGAAVETVTAGGTTRNIKISLTASGAKTVVVCFNGSVFSDMKGELRTFTGVLFTAGAEPYIRLSDSVNILPHKDLETLKSSIFFDRGLYKIFKAVGVVGDSLSVGHSGDAIRNVQFSWTKYVERDAGTSWRCFGQSGYTALDWINEWYGYNVSKMEGNKCQCYIIGLGVNDARTAALGSTEDITSDTTAEQTSFYGAYAKIIYLLKDINPNAKIICLTNPRSNTGGDVNGFNNAIKYISAEHFGKDDNVFLLDLNAYSDLFSNANGIIAKDHTAIGSHYSPIGYRAIANVMEYAVDQLMTENQERFADVYSIPYDGGDGTVNTYQ